MIYEAQAISFVDSFVKPPRGRIGVAAISAIILLIILMNGLPLSPGGSQFWTVTGITIFSCALIWSTLLAVMAMSEAPSKILGYAATAFFIIGVLATLLAAVLIAIALLIFYFGFKIVRSFMESDEDREAREERERQEKIQEAERLEAAALAEKQHEEKMLEPFGPCTRCSCGHIVSKKADYCPECGGDPRAVAPAFVSSTMDCRNCGHTVNKEAAFCPECGGNPREAARDLGSSIRECRNCGHTVSKEATFCPECGGNPQEAARDFASSTMECRNCGHSVSKNASYCPGCGGDPQVEARRFGHSTKECGACGHLVNKDAIRCTKCGAPVELGLLD